MQRATDRLVALDLDRLRTFPDGTCRRQTYLEWPDRVIATSHEITVSVCRWSHANVHDLRARDYDGSPDLEAIAQRDSRRACQQDELSFETAAERYDE